MVFIKVLLVILMFSMYFPHFDGQIEKRNFVEKGIRNYGSKESLSDL